MSLTCTYVSKASNRLVDQILSRRILFSSWNPVCFLLSGTVVIVVFALLCIITEKRVFISVILCILHTSVRSAVFFIKIACTIRLHIKQTLFILPCRQVGLNIFPSTSQVHSAATCWARPTGRMLSPASEALKLFTQPFVCMTSTWCCQLQCSLRWLANWSHIIQSWLNGALKISNLFALKLSSGHIWKRWVLR